MTLVLYLTMRFATAIKQIQNLRAYHAGDRLFVEVCFAVPFSRYAGSCSSNMERVLLVVRQRAEGEIY